MVSTIAGSAPSGLVDGVGTAAKFNNPIFLAVTFQGTIFVSDTNNDLIRQISSSGNGVLACKFCLFGIGVAF